MSKNNKEEAPPPEIEPWNPTEPVAQEVKRILEEIGAVVSVRPERTIDDLGLVPDTVRLRMNGRFFPTAANKLSSSDVTGNTSVLTLVNEIEALGGH
jgi:hypothetical protein